MQVRAIFEAACTVAARKGRVMPEVMVPLTASVVEFRKQAFIVRQVAEEVFRERQITVPFLLGTMIELPRACVTADELAREAQFFSFGTNDLTQTTWGLSRDDAGHFLPYYLEHGVIEADPFQVLDQAGVGKLMQMACDLGRRTRNDLKLGICGEHGGEPGAVAFCAPAAPIAKVATGTPAGICTIESSESSPWRCLVGTGTPKIGSDVFAASIPGRWAAPPAPAMMQRSPRPAASSA